MLRVIIRRLASAIPTLLVVSLLVFLLLETGSGDAAVRLAGENASPQLIEEIRAQLRLDDPLPTRYARWLADAVTGDFGKSFSNDVPARSLIFERMTVTFSLAFVAMVFAVGFGGIAGILAALRPRSLLDRAVTALSAIAIAAPLFWLGLILVLHLSVDRQWFPSLGYVSLTTDPGGWLHHLILPGLALSTFAGAELALQLKGSLTETLRRDYILAARAKGLSNPSLVLKHGLKNAFVPVITVLGFRLSQLLGGTVIIESVFSLPGIGALALSSTLNRDVPVMLAIVVMTTLVVVVINLLVDISYFYFNPKLRT